MPNVWSHILFGDAVLRRAGLPDPLHPKVYHFGCQGPDFLLYHNFLPWKRGQTVSDLGNMIHKRKCGPFLIDLIQAAKEQPDMREYVAGFVTHHILDRWTHPYIIYRSGDGKFKHQELEVIIDTLLALRLERIRTWKTPVVPRIDIGDQLPGTWVRVFQRLSEKHFPELAAKLRTEDWHQAYRDMLRALRLFFDPTGIKLVLTLGYIAPFRYRKVDSKTDYLNEALQVWVHPAVPKERHRESFWSLWEKALEEGVDIVSHLHAYWRDEGDLEALREGIGNVSYDTGKDCEANLTNRVADPIV